MGARVSLVALALALMVPASGSNAVAPLYDPVTLNIGISCRWDRNCERGQLKAMRAARKFMGKEYVPPWKIQLCNRNARRGAAQVDWIGFNSCLRNPHLLGIQYLASEPASARRGAGTAHETARSSGKPRQTSHERKKSRVFRRPHRS